MRTEVIKADTIDLAVRKILIELRVDTTSSRESAIYFDGWNGLGASAVLQAVARRLTVSNELATKPTGLEFEKIINIDCSKWESRRAMQRKIAEQLELPTRVINMFDKQDEEDDFNVLDQGSRGEIAQVTRAIYRTLQDRRFLVILHNGSNEEIDILNFGLSLYGYANSKLLWTFQGRFRLDPKMIDNVKESTTTNVVFSASRDVRDPQELWSYLVHHEAAQVSCNKHGHCFIDPATAAECVLYMLKQSWIGSRIVDYDWAIHTSNYWICDGIITMTDIDDTWQVGDGLLGEMPFWNIITRLNKDESAVSASHHLARSAEDTPYWISTTTSSSGFVVSPSGVIPENMFQHSQRLGMLKLSRCTFNFSSPPFLCCHSLRFLWLDHCKDLLVRRSTTNHQHTEANKEAKELGNNTKTTWECFQSLWVLDLRYTDWDQILSAGVMDLMTHLMELNVVGAKNLDMSHLRVRLHNIRKLRVKNSTCLFNNDVFSLMESIELLDFSGNTIREGMRSLCGEASSNLKTVIIDGCQGLENLSFRASKELKNLLLKGWIQSLQELDLSGTKVRTLDLGAVQATLPKRIILLGCEKLRAVLWPKNAIAEKWPDVLQIDTTSTTTSTDGGEEAHAYPYVDPSLQQQKQEKFKDGWQISLKDARLLRSLSPVRGYLSSGNIHIDICSTTILCGSNIQGTTSDKSLQVKPHTSTIMDSEYRDVLKGSPVEVMMMMSECPEITWSRPTCIIKVIMHGQDNKLLEDAPSASTSALSLPDFICEGARSLHVYDNSSITSIPSPPEGSGWEELRWCRVERCPKIHTIFILLGDQRGTQGSSHDYFFYLQTFWVSQLLSAHYIWDRPVSSAYPNLRFLHLDNCPRLVYVLPFSKWDIYALYALETLEIVYCSDLKEVFPLGLELQEKDYVIELPHLRRINLHELPRLQRICGRRMWAPHLETIKIRGCWSLRRLPLVAQASKPPKVDCEKEWWNNLEWDGLEWGHHPSLYQPIHSLYYKTQLPRVSVLR